MVSDVVRYYGGFVWTNHALDRLKKRSVAQSDAALVLKKPDKTFPGKREGSVKFIRTVNGRRLHVVASLNDDKQWVVMSVWVRGEEDRKWWVAQVLYGIWWVLKMIWKGLKWVFRLEVRF